ncbi:MAG: UDP-N-acetylmuramate dehydrogenase [Candidatus Margulisiibacteriota bacterium]
MKYPELQDIKGKLFYNEPLSKHTSLKIGGLANAFLVLEDIAELKRVIDYSAANDVPLIILGNGTNVLISDDGFNGIVIRLPSGISAPDPDYKIEKRIVVEAGCPLIELIRYCEKNNFGGLEFLIGIPGTIGGLVVSNAGSHGKEICEFIVSVECINKKSGTLKSFQNEECGFTYRRSIFAKKTDWIIARIFIQMPDMPFTRDIGQSLKKWRKRTQPVSYPNIGSIFKNPEGYYAGELIERYVGKGFSIGKAAVSDEHANIFINTGGATSKDFKQLIAHAKNVVYDNTGVRLEEEITYIG